MLGNKFLALDKTAQKQVHIILCIHSLNKWDEYCLSNKRLWYCESVCGTVQKIDKKLPNDAFECVVAGKDKKNVNERYTEPTVAMQDDDIRFPDEVEYAYYSVYNLYRKYIQDEDIDSWMIVSQALSTIGDLEASKLIFKKALKKVTNFKGRLVL